MIKKWILVGIVIVLTPVSLFGADNYLDRPLTRRQKCCLLLAGIGISGTIGGLTYLIISQANDLPTCPTLSLESCKPHCFQNDANFLLCSPFSLFNEKQSLQNIQDICTSKVIHPGHRDCTKSEQPDCWNLDELAAHVERQCNSSLARNRRLQRLKGRSK